MNCVKTQSTDVFYSDVKIPLRWSLEFLLLEFWPDVRWKWLFYSPSTFKFIR